MRCIYLTESPLSPGTLVLAAPAPTAAFLLLTVSEDETEAAGGGGGGAAAAAAAVFLRCAYRRSWTDDIDPPLFEEKKIELFGCT